ncbi:MerR family transcriptional regulator [Paenibacillus massiliensis]|uniref:MerR family transcriptional regulator n=1 Tax=Paenibacillus massiliensis TaxID=225917 RepID=UPI001F468B76|nr:TipAS antibiotic-recognition domain-containing protein [Paenibacillus massiliensis]
MAYTLEEVSDMSGMPLEELNRYEQNGWLKPSLVPKDGVHYYDERGLLCLQHLMICQELVMPGEELAMWMHRYEEAPADVLLEHRLRIKQKAQRMHLLVQTIDLTLSHLNGEFPLEHRKLFSGLQLQQSWNNARQPNQHSAQQELHHSEVEPLEVGPDATRQYGELSGHGVITEDTRTADTKRTVTKTSGVKAVNRARQRGQGQPPEEQTLNGSGNGSASVRQKHEDREEQEQSQQPEAWPKEKYLQSQAEVEEIHHDLIAAIKDGEEPGSKRVQAIVRRHLEWISHFYTPTAQIYSDLGDLYVEHEDFHTMYREYHPRLAEFLRDGMKILAACELK